MDLIDQEIDAFLEKLKEPKGDELVRLQDYIFKLLPNDYYTRVLEHQWRMEELSPDPETIYTRQYIPGSI